VRAVQGSALWGRAQRADRLLAEVTFAAPGVVAPRTGSSAALAADRRVGRGRGKSRSAAGVDGAGRGDRAGARPQLDLFGAQAATGETEGAEVGTGTPAQPQRVLEGVIDLAFREPDGWVVADYKTDVGTDPEFAKREAAYRRQVDLYAEAWERLSGERVKERVLFFTTQGRIESW
jgi:hypothetical protein